MSSTKYIYIEETPHHIWWKNPETPYFIGKNEEKRC